MNNQKKDTHASQFKEGDKVTVTILKGGYWQGTVNGTFIRQTSDLRATVEVGGKRKSYSVYNINPKRSTGRR